MTKQLRHHWQIRELVDSIIARLAPGELIIPRIRMTSNVAWDEECEGLGRLAWNCDFLCPNLSPTSEIMCLIRAAIAPWQRRYDIGVTAD